MSIPCACGKPKPCYLGIPCTNLANPKPEAYMGNMNIVSIDAMVKRLQSEGGAIVNASALSAYDLAIAQQDGRVFVDASGRGLVLQTQDWLDSTS